LGGNIRRNLRGEADGMGVKEKEEIMQLKV